MENNASKYTLAESETIKEYYSAEIEKNRLDLEFFQLEGIRTKEIISRYLDRDNLTIIDIGGRSRR